MNQLDQFNFKRDPDRPCFVILHSDHSHVLPAADNLPAWSYSRENLETLMKVESENFDLTKYYICDLDLAIALISNRQSELEKAWQKPIENIRRTKSINERLNIYRNFVRKTNSPHPIRYDEELKSLLNIS